MSTEVVGKDPNGRVRIVELEAPRPITESRLRQWSEGFSIPTVVRNAFSPPPIEPSRFLPPERVLFADVGKVGEFRDFNGQYPWSKIWSSMEAGEDVYGSFGTGTPNLDEVTVGAIQALKRTILPADVFAKDENPGHVIFGSTTRRQATTGWHNAMDANLLLQLHGTKEWYSLEQLPPPFHPVGIGTFTMLVDREGSSLSRDEDEQRELFDVAAHVTVGPGDMLINPPLSWHAVEIDGFNLSLSFRGDRSDVMAWLAYRYFGGRIDHPFMASFGSLFDSVTYGSSPRSQGEQRLDLRMLRRELRRTVERRLSSVRSRVERWLGAAEPFNPILDEYSASTSAFMTLRAEYRAKFEKYAAEP